MTREEAALAAKVKAFVKTRPLGSHQHWGHGQIIEVHGSKASVRSGARVRDVDLGDVYLDETKNRESGIAVPPPAADARAARATPEPLVIINLADMTGWTGSGWSEDDARWKRYVAREEATTDKGRFSQNGIKGLEILAPSAAVDRIYQRVETATAPAKPSPIDIDTLGNLSKGLGDYQSIAEWSQELAKLVEEDKVDERDNVSDSDLKSRLEVQIMELSRQITAIDNRVRDRIERRARRTVLLAGLKAKLSAILGAGAA